ncbi:DUF7519 family protein [Natronobacterium haloterrestre]|nr:hypothetical protein [Halobiforma haloterrestris]
MATELRIVLLAGIGVLTTAYLLSRLPGLHRLRYSTTLRWVPVFIGGVFVTALVTVGYPRVFEHWVRPEVEQSIAEQETVFLPILEEELQLQELLPILSPPNGIAIAGLGITGIVGAVLGVFLLLWLLGSFQLLPDRGAPGTIGAAALVGGTIIAATAGASTLVVTGGVACAIVSWDAAVYGVSVTEELGRDTDVGRPTLSHTLGAVLVGVVGIGIALGLNRLAEAITVQTGVTIAISLIVGLLVSFIAVKRRATSKAITTRSTTASPRTTAATDHSVSAAGDDSVATAKDATVSVDTVPLLDVHEARMLRAAGFETIGDLQAASQSELEAVTGVSDETVAAVIAAVADGKDRNE